MSSSTGGYLLSTTPALPGGLTMARFIQQMIVGVTGYTASTVRPKYQAEPPKQPDLSTNWIAFGFQVINQQPNAYVGMNELDVTQLLRQIEIGVDCSFFGPNAQDNIQKFCDAFQVQQNLEVLRSADMSYKSIGFPTRGTDLVNMRFIERYDVTLILVQRVLRTYQIQSVASVEGSLHTTVEGQDYNTDFETPPPEV